MHAIDQARSTIDAANAADPQGDALAYADAIEHWLGRLVPEPSPALHIAARGQHLERWAIPREDYPMDRPGYHRWRMAVHARQGERAVALLQGIVGPELAERVSDLVSKRADDDPEGQALEDAACLVFLDRELEDFDAVHPGYSDQQYLRIFRRTVKKMSPAALALATEITLPPRFAALLRVAGRE
ncbi:MAG: DUF4202 domain-containing protein [Planctomycetota bacterium]